MRGIKFPIGQKVVVSGRARKRGCGRFSLGFAMSGVFVLLALG